MSTASNRPEITLRPTAPADLDTLFAYQADADWAYTAAFVNESYTDKEAYIAKWTGLLANESTSIYTILADGKVVGSISNWMLGDEQQVSYGIAKEYWGRGIVTSALRQFLALVPRRPIFGRVAFDNVGSASVLARCGFRKSHEDTFYAHARKQEIAEFIYVLED